MHWLSDLVSVLGIALGLFVLAFLFVVLVWPWVTGEWRPDRDGESDD